MHYRTLSALYSSKRLSSYSHRPLPAKPNQHPVRRKADDDDWSFTPLRKETSMANLTRFNPFGEITRSMPFGKLDELFDNLENILPSRIWEPVPRIKMDVIEDNAAYTVHAEIPGARKDDIKVQVEGRQITIMAEVKKQSETREGERMVHAERYYGRESRSIMLDHEVDEKKAVAKYDNGVLELKLPILEASRAAHQLPIQ
jgi:HSP20 family protein